VLSRVVTWGGMRLHVAHFLANFWHAGQSHIAVIEVAERYGVSRQAVHGWLRRYAAGGLDALAAADDAYWRRP
jgi:uncharacterized protein YjcR